MSVKVSSTILLITCDDELALMFKKTVKSDIYTIHSADSIEQMIETLNEKHDLSLIVYGNYPADIINQFCNVLKEVEVPIVILTGKSKEDVVAQGKRILSYYSDEIHKYKNLINEYESIFDHLPALVFYKDNQNRFIRVNKYVAQAHKKTKSELEGVSLYDLYPYEIADMYFKDDLEVINSGEPKINIEEPWNTEDGLKWVSTSKMPFVNDDGKIAGIIGISSDITERKISELQIKELVRQLEIEKNFAQKNAMTDGLTGIMNRRFFDEILGKEFFRMKRSGCLLSLIMVDVDYFKKFNDQYGHLKGDDCLKQVASVIKASVGRGTDVVARYGGEEIAVILPETDNHGAMLVAERMKTGVEKLMIPHIHSAASEHVTISIGVASVNPKLVTIPEQIIELADDALYIAKERGRNRIETLTFDSGVKDSTHNITTTLVHLVWHEGDSCNNPIIDSQHKKLFDDSNKLISAVINESPKEECIRLINILLNDIVNHFRDEESIILAAGYPDFDKHVRSHSGLIKKAMELSHKFEMDTILSGELIHFIAYDVVAQHMFIEDRLFFPYL